MAGQTNFCEFLALFCLSDVLVASDSGPSQFASMTDIEAVVSLARKRRTLGTVGPTEFHVPGGATCVQSLHQSLQFPLLALQLKWVTRRGLRVEQAVVAGFASACPARFCCRSGECGAWSREHIVRSTECGAGVGIRGALNGKHGAGPGEYGAGQRAVPRLPLSLRERGRG